VLIGIDVMRGVGMIVGAVRRRFRLVMLCLEVMTVGNVRVVVRHLMFALVMGLGGLTVMVRGLFMVFRGLGVVLGESMFGHGSSLPCVLNDAAPRIAPPCDPGVNKGPGLFVAANDH
jgi:hypothetical protein